MCIAQFDDTDFCFKIQMAGFAYVIAGHIR